MFRTGYVAALLAAFVAGASAIRADIYSVSPTWAHSYQVGSESRDVTITGCGFTTYSEVTCVWDDKIASKKSWIEDDGTVVCVMPDLVESEDYDTLPFSTSLHVIWDGDYDNKQYVAGWTWGPSCISSTNLQGPTAGGWTVSVSGIGFAEFSTAQVYLDNVQAPVTATIGGDTSLSFTTPAGGFNQWSMINVRFDNNPMMQMHCQDTIHWGPVVTSVTPTCGLDIDGRDMITITGTDFSSSLFETNQVEVEFEMSNGDRHTRMASVSSNRIVVTTPKATGYGITAAVKVIFDWNYLYESYESFSILYGPSFSSYTPTQGYVDNQGEVLTIFGCGFDNYTNSDVTVNMNGNQNLECNNPAINSAGTQITCQYPTRTNCDTSVSINVELDGADGSTQSYTFANQFYQAPMVNTASSARGPRSGGQSVSFTGTKMRRSSNGQSSVWSNPQCEWTTSSTSDTTASVSDTSASCTSPSKNFGDDGTFGINFGTDCFNSVYDPFPYHWGPLCTGVNPTNGPVLGGGSITLQGAGFNDEPAYDNSIDVFFCLTRLFGNSASGSYDYNSCPGRPNQDGSATAISVQLPSYSAIRDGSAINSQQSGIRLFGDTVRFELRFADGNTVEEGTIECWDAFANPIHYRFGPYTTAVSPNKAEFGPRDDYNSVGVSVSYSDSDAYTSGSATNGGNGLMVGIGASGLTGEGLLMPYGSSAQTIWGGQANSQNDVYLFFDTCNTSVTTDSVHWGPQISSVTWMGQTVPDSFFGQNIWGVKPWGGETVTITGAGFMEFDGEVQCVIDDIEITANVTDDNTIECLTPERQFWTSAAVLVRFGKLMRDPSLYDWTRAIYAPATLQYRPWVGTQTGGSSVLPTAGHTKGGESVTIHGMGLDGWDSGASTSKYPGGGDYKCFFANQPATFVSASSTQVVCTTPTSTEDHPTAGAHFNSDVDVTIQLYGTTRLDGFGQNGYAGSLSNWNGDNNYDWRVVAPDTYHYGPTCTGISPAAGLINYNGMVTAVGTLFEDDEIVKDAMLFWTMGSSTTNLTWWNDVNSDGAIPSDVRPPKATSCGQTATLAIHFRLLHDLSIVEIPCTAGFRYGPAVTAGGLLVNGNADNHGWGHASVTITGALFHDSDAWIDDTNLDVRFGNTQATLKGSSTSTSIVVNAPQGNWRSTASVTVAWVGAVNETCAAQTSGTFFYGAELTSITPNQGYTQGIVSPSSSTLAKVTVFGAGFDCDNCQFSQYDCLWYDGNSITDVTSGSLQGGGVVCDVLPSDQVLRTRTVGLRFNDSTSLQLAPSTASGTVSYLYGPTVLGNSLNARIAGDNYNYFTGVFLDDPFFNYPTDTDNNDLVQVTGFGTPSSVDGRVLSASTIEYTVPAWAGKACGASDSVKPVWDFPTGTAASNTCSGGDFCFSTSYTFTYGNPAAEVTSATTRFDTKEPNEQITVAPVSGYNSVDGSESAGWFDYLQADYGVFGGVTAMCVFTSTSDANHALFSKNIVSASTNDVTCDVPEGPFYYDATVSVVLNPKNDAYTTEASSFRWVPYAIDWSCPWAALDSGEPRVVYGDGFMYYDNSEQGTVLCDFGASMPASQADLTDDFTLTCRTPRATSSQVVTVTLQFCDHAGASSSGDWCGCEHFGTWDSTNVRQQFTFVGINDFSPKSGPNVGSTTVAFEGFGFSSFDSIDSCSFGGKTVVPTNVTSTSFTCKTPTWDLEDVAVVDITVTATWNGHVYTMYAPAQFDYGKPEVTSVSRQRVAVGASADFVVSGNYLNGGTTYECLFTEADLAREGNTEFVVAGTRQCNSNSLGATLSPCTVHCELARDALSSIGDYVVEVSYDGAAFSDDNMAFILYQNPLVTGIEKTDPADSGDADVISLVGGEERTIIGDNFNGGSVYLVRWGDDGPVTMCTLFSNDVVPTPMPTPSNNSTGNFTVAARNERPVVRGIGDRLECITPASRVEQEIDVRVSIDGGHNFTDTFVAVVYDSFLPTTVTDPTLICASSTVTLSWITALIAVIVAMVAF